MKDTYLFALYMYDILHSINVAIGYISEWMSNYVITMPIG